MITESVMEAFFNAIVWVLTPIQRWQATRRLEPDYGSRWLVVSGVTALVILTILFFIVSYLRILEGRKVNRELFVEYANKRGLSERERQILLGIVGAAGLKQSSVIFTMSGVFDREAAKMVEESLARYGQEAGNQLRAELSLLREKLGFKVYSSASIGSTTKPPKMSSRRIPAGRQVYIRHLERPELGEVEATVMRSDSMEFAIQLSDSVEGTVGEKWRVHCYFGSTIWEFDTSVVGLDDEQWVLNHSDDVRFISRRGFPRVAVNRPAFIAKFSFLNQVTTNLKNSNVKDSSKTEKPVCEVPQFVPAVVTELAGSGLRIETSLKVKPDDRILVVFNLEEKRIQHPMARTNRGGETLLGKSELVQGSVKVATAISKIAEDVGEVRDVKEVKNGFSIGVELTGLTEFDLEELIRATNIASMKSDDGGGKLETAVGSDEYAEGGVAKPAAVKGV